jgi:hypothetical protein
VDVTFSNLRFICTTLKKFPTELVNSAFTLHECLVLQVYYTCHYFIFVVSSTWRRGQNPVSETLCFVK